MADWWVENNRVNEVNLLVPVPDVTTDLAVGDGKETFRLPFAMTITEVRASVSTAPVGSTIIVDIEKNGVSIFTTLLTIDAAEKTSVTAAIAAVLVGLKVVCADDDELKINIDQVGSGTAGKGLRIIIKGTR